MPGGGGILTAIHDAVGVRIPSLPATAEKVLAAIIESRAKGVTTHLHHKSPLAPRREGRGVSREFSDAPARVRAGERLKRLASGRNGLSGVRDCYDAQ